jgi:hypothetical protein
VRTWLTRFTRVLVNPDSSLTWGETWQPFGWPSRPRLSQSNPAILTILRISRLAASKVPNLKGHQPLVLGARISLFFFRISLFLLDKLSGLVLNTPLVEKHYVP